MASANPAMNPAVFQRAGVAASPGQVMTVRGTVVKTALLLAILVAAAAYTWSKATAGEATIAYGLLIAGAIGGGIVALITIFVPRVSPFTAPLYAALEGLLLGAISAVFQASYPGIAIQAVGLTVAVTAVMLFVYGTGIIRVTRRFMIGVVAATGAVCLVYLVEIVLSFFGVSVPYIHGSGPVGIIFSLVVVAIAALNLILDFDFIEQGARYGAPKYMEWYGGFSLLVTLIWMYLEMLRLLAKMRGGRD